MKKLIIAGFYRVSRIFVLLAMVSQGTKAMNVNSINTNDYSITVHFDNPVVASSATNTGNYTIFTKTTSSAAVVAVTNAVLQTNDLQTVALYLNSSAGEFFAVGVSNVVDSIGTSNNAEVTGYTGYYATNDIGTASDPLFSGEAIPSFSDTYTMTANGSDIGGTNDHCLFLYGQVTNNFDMSVQLTRLDYIGTESKAGLFAREDLSAGGRSVGVFMTPVAPPAGTNLIITSARTLTNEIATPFTTPIVLSSLEWLRMTRTNNAFTVYYSTNGTSWSTMGSLTQALSGTLDAGLALTSQTNGVDTTAEFTGFNISGKRPGDDITPKLSVSIYQHTNVVAMWQRTPHDYALQVVTNLSSAGTNSLSVSNAPQWSYLMNPTFDTDLTGTNAAMPGRGRYMIIPMDLFSNQPIYMRLARVDRLIPDPASLAFGIVVSQIDGNETSSSISSIDNFPVVATTAVTPTNYFTCMGRSGTTNYIYTFTTQPSSRGYNYLIEAIPKGGFASPIYGTNYGVNSGYSYATVTPTTTGNYSYIAAATTHLTNAYIAVEVLAVTNSP